MNKIAIATLFAIVLGGCAADPGAQYQRRTYALNGSTLVSGGAQQQPSPYGSPYGYGGFEPAGAGEASRLRAENSELRRLVVQLSSKVEELTGAVSQLLRREQPYTPAASRPPTEAPRLVPAVVPQSVVPEEITEDHIFEAAFSGGQLPVARGARRSSETEGNLMPAAYHPDRSAAPSANAPRSQRSVPPTATAEPESSTAPVPSTRPVYDVVLKAGEGEDVKRLLRFFKGHGFKDIFAGSTTVYLGTFHDLSRADDRRKMIQNTTGIQPEIVRRIVPARS